MKRLLSCVLALIMIISIVPITAMASENTDVVTDDQNVVADEDSRYDYTAIFDQQHQIRRAYLDGQDRVCRQPYVSGQRARARSR